ncbi:unnamed protein product [Mytilus edulis]|uniref:Integrase zinc-binding domain-containing protein n=1 Tax=Mytilus edulis TaxID=6550 RepID=A0A8S3SLZ1_MYTED|nr:unnamed protein product [Mytilus edulis]
MFLSRCFSKSPSDIGHTELVNHKINTGNAKPIKLKPYRLPLAKREVAEKEIQDMASRGIIEPSREVEINNEILTKEVVVKSVVVDDTNTLTGAVRVEGSQRIETSKKPKVAQLYASYRSDDLNASKSCTKHENERVNISDKVKDESGFVSKASHDARKSSSSHTFNVPNLKRSEKIKGKRGFAGETSVDVCKSKTHENIINQRVGVVKTRSMKPNPLDQQKPSSSSPMHDEQFVEMDFDLENEQENDPVLKIIRDWLVNNLKPIWSEISKFSPIIKYFWNRIESFEIRDGIICRKWESEKGDNVTWQKVIPENLKEGVLKQLHNSVTGGHLGIKKTLSKICKPAETKEQRLKKIKDVLQDLMSENGETITISVEPEADKVEEDTSSQILEEEVELHVSETEVNTLKKQITITRIPPPQQHHQDRPLSHRTPQQQRNQLQIVDHKIQRTS